jgi:VanZ family protein
VSGGGDQARGGWLLATLLYALLIAYGSLFPLTGWTEPADAWSWLQDLPGRRRLSWPDLVVNVLAYMPLGFGLARVMAGGPAAMTAVVATSVGFGLSLSVEWAQTYLPSRVPALSDLITNTAGTGIGALLGVLAGGGTRAGQWLVRQRTQWIVPGRRGDVALMALGLWALSQLSPLVPSFDLGNLRQGVAPLWRALTGVRAIQPGALLEYLFATAALALLAHGILREERRSWPPVLAALSAVLLMKIPVVGRDLAAEAVAGLAGGLMLAAVLSRLQPLVVAAAGLLLLLATIVTEALNPGTAAVLTPFNWVPFKAHLANPLTGVNAILEASWSAFALAWFARRAWPGPWPFAALAGGGALGVAVWGLERAQASVPGRVGDVTTVVVAVLAWAVAAGLLRAAPEAVEPVVLPNPSPRNRRRRGSGRRRWIEGAATVGGALVLAGLVRWAVTRAPVEAKVDRRLAPRLPAPEELPPVTLAGFRNAHPRLPHPSAADRADLQRLNPGYVREQRRRANGGRGDLQAAALMELLEPGSQDIDHIAQRLLDLKFSFRGHEQGRTLALVYDWLHDRWSTAQREALRAKVANGANYLIGYIREERLSPYNVYLYNAPFQALMACALALYGDDPRGAPVMAFTHDLWLRRVLPVWRQVMGRQGGWHEGAEYVGIGIGQAIYQVPAMWRAATGEDLFAQEPGIRGFLDFLVHRTLPDESHWRWGDGQNFDRFCPDAAALAIEYRHAAAYTLRPPRPNEPSAWPWGPLTESTLRDPSALNEQPLSRHFDGIGMLVARNRWTDDATHVVFKAGDNYWSHVHLDQGAFTIHRGGPLAIDAGLYAAYGSDHHLNYQYQTVAHNTITVTDPDDTVPAPPRSDKEKSRPIANDGGQRRVGSGWGVERAPLDLDEWQAKRSIYHTGLIVRHLDEEGISAALADITPAYTNELSGRGTFTHRTRRVERCWRFFAYDRVDDVVVVYDDVRATRAGFRKRWLLHTIHAPRIQGRRFVAAVPPAEGLRRPGGELHGHVVLPERAVLNAIGGPGLEYFVDGVNYDDQGAIAERLQRRGRERDPARPEPGAWRLELSPEQDAQDDQFLVVLLPAAFESPPAHGIRPLQRGDQVGVEVAGPKRTTRWWFRRGVLSAQLEVTTAGGDSRAFDLKAD